MNRFSPLRTALCGLLACVSFPALAGAQDTNGILQASLLSGWRQSDGSHMAAVSITLAPGWKTYWRAPGDAGIPPVFDMTGSRNLATTQIVWPRPEVFFQNGMRSIGYHDAVVLPMQVTPTSSGQDIALRAQIDIGVCKDICIPKTLKVSALLPHKGGARDGRIAAALADRPYSAQEVGAQNLRCRITPTKDGLELSVSVALAKLSGTEAAAIETGDPLLWVSEPQISRSGGVLTATASILHVEGAPFVLNRSALRTTLLGDNRAVELKGCSDS